MSSIKNPKENQLKLYAVFISIVLLIVLFYTYRLHSNQSSEILREKDPPQLLVEKRPNSKLQPFDPNQLSASEWQQLGFSEKQAATILKYKTSLGGNFRSKEEIKRCFVISDEKFEELSPFMMIKDIPKQNKSQFVAYDTQKKDYYSQNKPNNKLRISRKFDPNTFDANDWERIGFTPKQAEAIIKYKYYLGGKFSSKDELKRCYVISPENYSSLSPYLVFPAESKTFNTPKSFQKTFKSKPTIEYHPFDPNAFSKTDWMNFGFTEAQANTILKYKNKVLGGKFKNTEEIKACYVISEEKFNELLPYISFSKKSETVEKKKSSIDFSSKNLNTITKDELIEFGLSPKQASSFVGFRDKLGGFVEKNQIYETYNMDKKTGDRLVNDVALDGSRVKKYTLLDAPEGWLKTHPYFRYSADKIIYYRISEDNEKKIWKKMNIKPEYVQKMKLYLID